MTKQELQERCKTLTAEIRQKAETFHGQEKRWKDAEEKANWEKLNADYDEARAKLTEIEEAEAVEGRLNDLDQYENESRNRSTGLPGREDYRADDGDSDEEDENKDDGDEKDKTRSNAPSERQQAIALQAFFRSQLGLGLEDVHVRSMRACRMHPGQRELVFRSAPTELIRLWQSQVRCRRQDDIHELVYGQRSNSAYERRVMSTFQASGGGAWVPSSFVRSLEINMLAFGGMRQVAQTIVTPSGEEMSWPTADDTSNEGVQIGETESVGTAAQPSAARVIWRAYKFSSNPVLVDYALLQDSAFDLPTMLGQMLGERIGRITNRKYTSGGGNGTPRGLLTAAESGTTATTSIDFDDILALEHSVDPAYRSNSQYMMHDSILLAVRLLKDLENRYLFSSGVDAGKPDSINSHPLTINQHMDSTTASGKKPVVFGDLSRYKIRRVGEIRMYRMEERYRDQDQDGFIALVREDGNLLNAGTCPVKYILMS